MSLDDLLSQTPNLLVPFGQLLAKLSHERHEFCVTEGGQINV
jgi:hypothetical protein